MYLPLIVFFAARAAATVHVPDMYLPLIAFFAARAAATVHVPGIFSDGMVLQEHATYDQRPFIYGTAEAPGELITVIRHRPYSNANDTYTAQADANRDWIVQLDPDYFRVEDNNLTIFISGSLAPQNTIVIREAVYGDVFLCGGQSNMNENVAACFDANATMARQFPNLRLFSMAEAGAATPQKDIPPFVSVDSASVSSPPRARALAQTQSAIPRVHGGLAHFLRTRSLTPTPPTPPPPTNSLLQPRPAPSRSFACPTRSNAATCGRPPRAPR
jgi:hypothetical protein